LAAALLISSQALAAEPGCPSTSAPQEYDIPRTEYPQGTEFRLGPNVKVFKSNAASANLLTAITVTNPSPYGGTEQDVCLLGPQPASATSLAGLDAYSSNGIRLQPDIMRRVNDTLTDYMNKPSETGAAAFVKAVGLALRDSRMCIPEI
jgi:hypothetical protein